MKISEFSVKNSLFINLLSIFFILVGFLAIFNLNKEVFPNVPFDIAQISIMYPGATSEDIEKLITTPIEKELKEVDDIEEIRSVSSNNISTIYIKMNPDAKDKNKIVNDVQRAVDKVRDLPADSEDPVVEEINMKLIPVIEVALSGAENEFELQNYAEGLEGLILNLPEVARIRRKGWRNREVWVEVHPEKLREYYISLEEIMLALKTRNLNLPAGTMRGKENEYIIRTSGEFLTTGEIEETIIRASDIGNWLKIKDVARVVDQFEDENEMTKSFGNRAINLVISKKEKADAIKLVDKVKNIIASFKKTIPKNVRIYTLNDMSFYITRRLNVLKNNGIVGVILVMVILRIFLTRRVAFFTAIGIPIAFSITLGYMLASGMSINMMTMFGLIIVLGMIVDDGIIIAENSYRYMESGMPPREAAIRGTEEVIPAVTTTIITTIVAFLPLAFMTGIIGRFMKSIPIVVIVALLASLLEAFIILPSHLADFVKPRKKDLKDKEEAHWFQSVITFYTKTIKKAIAHRYKTIAAFIMTVIILFVFTKMFLKVVAFPHKGIEEFYIRAEAPVGTSLTKTAALSLQLEKMVETLPDNELDSYVTTVGNIFEGRTLDPYARRGSHLVQVNVYLTPEIERKREASAIIDSLRDKAGEIKGFEKIGFEQVRGGPPTGKAIDIKIKGDDYAMLNEIARKYIGYLKSLKGVTDIDTDYKFGKEEITVEVNKNKATAASLTTQDIAEGVRNAVAGGLATSIKQVKAEEEIDILVRFPKGYREDTSVFEKIVIPNKFGKLINLKDVAAFKKQKKLESYKHLDGKRALRVTALVDEKNITSVKANALIRKKFENIENDYLGYTIIYGGEEKDTQESFGNLFKAFMVAFFMIFLILATKFNSLVQPVIIMLAIVFGIFGALLALIIHNMEFSFMAFLGIVGLVGVVVNDSIVLVDFINRLRMQGKERRESIIEAGRLRLRPVILTTVTTFFALAPVAYGIGGLDPFLQPAALTLSWGLLFATFLTLIFIPCVYATVDDITLRIAHHATVIRNKRNNAKE
ncbi:MAG: efflux RND transporter permease subunit [Candidatus Omnitrophota bacterium]|nr:MAG: efflux RND transporter permease subunit [Candidatus Omnitrophota bacterium]